MREELALVIDCGSTNIRSIAINAEGLIVAKSSRPNQPHPQSDGKPGWLIWDLEEILLKIAETSREVTRVVGSENIRAVIVTTWGADGAPVRRDGSLTYPPISWQCPRTKEVIADLINEVSPWEIFKITGYQIIPFNTLIKLIWLRKNAPKALDDAYKWLMMPGLIVNRLTGKLHIDPTSASTMMAMDLEKRDWSESLLELAGLDASFFPEWYEPGQIVGYVTDDAGRKYNIQPETPVVVGGHDTQFAIVGSGAKPGEAILSSGTWEILAIRTESFKPTRAGFEGGLIIEADVQDGLWNPQMLMIGSAVLEWIREKFFHEVKRGEYKDMIKEACEAPPGANGITFIPSFVRESGPIKKYNTLGSILGLTLQASRGRIYRAALEGLSVQLSEALRILSESTGFHPCGIRVVGGGSKNALWNQIRANITGLPISANMQGEATALGASVIAFIGIGKYSSIAEAWRNIPFEEEKYEPDMNRSLYDKIYRRYMKALKSLKQFYEEY